MSTVLNHALAHHKYFEEIAAIPHGSFNEWKLTEYLISFAEAHQLKYVSDEMGNVVIYKDATPGYEDHAPVLLQGHIDMVCTKLPGSNHDFEKDPLELYIKDGYLYAKDTTLGADDGVGVAYMLSILDAENLKHPPLECAFTVQEETGCSGAAALKKEFFKAHRMIGLDDMCGGTSYASAAGGTISECHKSVMFEPVSGNVYQLYIDGLLGGHSGEDIEKERASAVKLMARTLYKLSKEIGIHLVSLDSGNAGNAIPNFAKAVFTTQADGTLLEEIVSNIAKSFSKEFEYSDPDVQLTLSKSTAEQQLCQADSQGLITFLRMLPNGFRHKNFKMDGVTVCSSSLGIVRIDENGFYAKSYARWALTSYMESLQEEFEFFCETFGIEHKIITLFPAFVYSEKSAMRDALDVSLREVAGKPLKPLHVHGGLETVYFQQMYEDMDIATIGPYCEDYHTPAERMNLESFDQIYQVIINTLEKL